MIRTAPDIALLRFLRSHAGDTAVLNDGGVSRLPVVGSEVPRNAEPEMSSPEPAAALLRAARALVPPGGEALPYAAIAASPQYTAYRELARRLTEFDPASLRGRAQRTAFWINLFNALVIDAVISFGVRESVREAPGFFHRAAYRVGPYRFALDDIEHGLLRANRPQHPRLPPPFPPGDPRAALGPGVLDPRVHFALNCGTRSCPPVAFYDAARLDEQLDAAAASFINGEGARVERGEVVISPLFEFYAEDFGGPEGAVAWLLRYLADPELRGRLADATARTGTYDWSLNRA